MPSSVETVAPPNAIDAPVAPALPTAQHDGDVTTETVSRFFRYFPELVRRLIETLAWRRVPGRGSPALPAAVANRLASELIGIPVDLRHGHLVEESEIYETVARRAGHAEAYFYEHRCHPEYCRLLAHISVAIAGVTAARACAIGMPALSGAAWSVPLEAALGSADVGQLGAGAARQPGPALPDALEDDGSRHRWAGRTVSTDVVAYTEFELALERFVFEGRMIDAFSPGDHNLVDLAAVLELVRGAPLDHEDIVFDRVDPERGRLLPFDRAVELFAACQKEGAEKPFAGMSEGAVLQLLPTFAVGIYGPMVWTVHLEQVRDFIAAMA